MVRRFLRWFLLAAALGLAGVAARMALEPYLIWSDDRQLLDQTRSAPNPRDAGPAKVEPTSAIAFEDVTLRYGLDFQHFDGAEGKYHLFETTGSGVAALDVNDDGWMDLFFVNGCRVPVDVTDRRHACKLFLNQTGTSFLDISTSAGAELVLFGQGCAVGDIDNDGTDDLYVTSFRRQVLLRNNGDGSFSDITRSANVESDRWLTSAAFADLDGDGNLDLYACAYADAYADKPIDCGQAGKPMHCGPQWYAAEPDVAYRNRGDGSFEPVADTSGLRDTGGRGLGVVAADVTNDALPDLFVANDTSANFLFLNKSSFRFAEQAMPMGVAFNGSGSTMSGMGIACADFDRNGWLDFYVTDFFELPNAYFVNQAGRGFLDLSDARGLGNTSRDKLGFGTVAIDADLDGWQDLFVANGHISDLTSAGVPYRMRQQFYRNLEGSFTEVSDSAGEYFHRRVLGRGAARFDFDNDGRMDLALNHLADSVVLLRNRTEPMGHWIGLELVGRISNRDGRNAVIAGESEGRSILYHLVSGEGYLSSSDPRLVIGLGDTQQAPRLSIRWPAGRHMELDTASEGYQLLLEPR